MWELFLTLSLLCQILHWRNPSFLAAYTPVLDSAACSPVDQAVASSNPLLLFQYKFVGLQNFPCSSDSLCELLATDFPFEVRTHRWGPGPQP